MHRAASVGYEHDMVYDRHSNVEKRKALQKYRAFAEEKWSMLRGSNPRPTPCKGAALPTELSIGWTRVYLNSWS